MEKNKIIFDKRDVFLTGKYLQLKLLSEKDIINSNWYGWFNDSDTTANMLKHYFPNSFEDQIDFLNSLKSIENKIQLGIIPKGEEKIVGIVSLQNIDYINSNADVSMLIGEPKYRKLILAQEGMQLMIDHAFFSLNLHKVYGGYFESLIDWGLFLMKRFGFQDEGIWKEHVYKNGKYIDIHRIGLLKDEYIRHLKKK